MRRGGAPNKYLAKGEEETMAKKPVIPWELKYDFAMRGYADITKAFLYAIRERFGATVALEIYERVITMGDRIKRFTNTIRNIFKIEDNDVEAIAKWWDIWFELTGYEWTRPERSKTITRYKITKCLWKTELKDISDRCLIFTNLVTKTINPKATVERLKGMCEGDPDCEFVTKMEA